jgi:hypothetical protein
MSLSGLPCHSRISFFFNQQRSASFHLESGSQLKQRIVQILGNTYNAKLVVCRAR